MMDPGLVFSSGLVDGVVAAAFWWVVACVEGAGCVVGC